MDLIAAITLAILKLAVSTVEGDFHVGLKSSLSIAQSGALYVAMRYC